MPTLKFKRVRYNGTRARAARRTATGSSKRAAKVAKTRSKTATKRNTTRITALARKLKDVRAMALGPVQSQLQNWDSQSHTMTADSPFLHQVCNPVHNSNHVMHWNNVTNGYTAIGHFNRDDSNFYEDNVHVFNDRVYLKYMLYEFEFSGYVSNQRMRIDVIQQTKLPLDTFSNYTQDQFLPHALGNFKNLAGFTQAYIHPKYFKHVVKTKYVYMNSKGSSSSTYKIATAADGDIDDQPFQATTTQPSTKYVRMMIPFNKFLKAEVTNSDEDTTDDPAYDSYKWDRGHPLKPTWMIISSDDTSANIGDKVRVKIHRKVVWRDQHA